MSLARGFARFSCERERRAPLALEPGIPATAPSVISSSPAVIAIGNPRVSSI